MFLAILANPHKGDKRIAALYPRAKSRGFTAIRIKILSMNQVNFRLETLFWRFHIKHANNDAQTKFQDRIFLSSDLMPYLFSFK